MLLRILRYICGSILIIGSIYGIYFFGTGRLYDEYAKLFEYRRLSPDFQPETRTIRVISAGHETTYADIIWINLIQYIGDNIGNGKFRTFINPLITSITDLHPYFTNAYDLAVLLSPSIKTEEDRERATVALRLGETGIEKTCDMRKMSAIKKEDFSKQLWENTALQNPCENGMLPYNVAYLASELGENEKAENYYKIASMNSDAPGAARFLGPLMRAKAGDFIGAAEKFTLLALDGYDEVPYTCQQFAMELLGDIKKARPLASYVYTLRAKEDAIIAPKDTKNPLTQSNSTCEKSISRALKQLYYAYITEVSRDRTDLRTGTALVRAGIIPSIPTIREQDGWNMIRNSDNNWQYIEAKYVKDE